MGGGFDASFVRALKDTGGNDDGYDEWIEILKKILYAFEAAEDESPPFLDWDEKKVEEGLDLFRKYFFHLWD